MGVWDEVKCESMGKSSRIVAYFVMADPNTMSYLFQGVSFKWPYKRRTRIAALFVFMDSTGISVSFVLCKMKEELSKQWHNFEKKLEVAIFGHFVYTRARQNAQK